MSRQRERSHRHSENAENARERHSPLRSPGTPCCAPTGTVSASARRRSAAPRRSRARSPSVTAKQTRSGVSEGAQACNHRYCVSQTLSFWCWLLVEKSSKTRSRVKKKTLRRGRTSQCTQEVHPTSNEVE